MRNLGIAISLMFCTSLWAQVPDRDENYWKAQQQVEFSRRNAVASEQALKEAEQRLQAAQTARAAAEKQLEKARQEETAAQAAVPAAQTRNQTAVQSWQDARSEFDRIRKP